MDKRCFKCNQVKPVSNFYAHPQMADGHLGKCKECSRRDVSENYSKRRLKYAAYENQREQRPERREAKRRYGKTHIQRYPDRAKARNAVSNAIRDGRLHRNPCGICGTRERVQAHHINYSRPLDVLWRCFRCHREEEHGQVTNR